MTFPLLLFIVASCSRQIDSLEDEIQRVPSPDGEVDAVVTRIGGGGVTISDLWWVYLVPSGTPITKDEQPLIRATHVSPGFSVVWQRARIVEIGYEKAKISHFTNVWYYRRLDGSLDRVELKLQARSSHAF